MAALCMERNLKQWVNFLERMVFVELLAKI